MEYKKRILFHILVALEYATEQNEIEIINTLSTLLVDNIKFKNKEQKEKYLDLMATFKDWDLFYKETMKLIKNS